MALAFGNTYSILDADVGVDIVDVIVVDDVFPFFLIVDVVFHLDVDRLERYIANIASLDR